jgi:hypothetical protein
VAVALVLVGALGLHACGGGDSRQAATPEATTTPAERTDPSAERQVITLTGCLERGVSPGEFTLMSVATAGVTTPAAPQRGADASRVDPESRADLQAASSYRLVTLDEDDDFSEYVGQRVTVSGRLAAEGPDTRTPSTPPEGKPVASDRTSATVTADAPPLRGFYVASIRKVDDSCSAQE